MVIVYRKVNQYIYGEEEFRNVRTLDQLFGMDSLAIIELVVGLEKEFKVAIPAEGLSFEIFRTVDTLSNYIQTLIETRSDKDTAGTEIRDYR